jgi:hypothetical protein
MVCVIFDGFFRKRGDDTPEFEKGKRISSVKGYFRPVVSAFCAMTGVRPPMERRKSRHDRDLGAKRDLTIWNTFICVKFSVFWSITIVSVLF